MGLCLLVFPGGSCQDYDLQQTGTYDTRVALTQGIGRASMPWSLSPSTSRMKSCLGKEPEVVGRASCSVGVSSPVLPGGPIATHHFETKSLFHEAGPHWGLFGASPQLLDKKGFGADGHLQKLLGSGSPSHRMSEAEGILAIFWSSPFT